MQNHDAKSTAKVILPDGKWDGGKCTDKKCKVPFNDFTYRFDIEPDLNVVDAHVEVEVKQSYAYIKLVKKDARKA